jgi:hypothetical protein
VWFRDWSRTLEGRECNFLHVAPLVKVPPLLQAKMFRYKECTYAAAERGSSILLFSFVPLRPTGWPISNPLLPGPNFPRLIMFVFCSFLHPRRRTPPGAPVISNNDRVLPLARHRRARGLEKARTRVDNTKTI